MPRRARIRIPGVPIHICHRGVDRAQCFFERAHHELYLGLLAEFARPQQCAIHAYVLMTNHVHLLLTPGTVEAASGLMKHVAQRYSQFINRTRKRSGPLWEGRFHSHIVDSSKYLLTCHKYVELNPVRAGMVRSPDEYIWSSYHANALGQPSPFIVPHPIYDALDGTPGKRTVAYRGLFRNELTPEELKKIRGALAAGTVLGSKEFEERMKAALGRPVTPGKPGRPRKTSQLVQYQDVVFA